VNSQKFTAMLGDEVVTIETGKLAQQAGGAVTVRQGDTVLLVTATMSHSAREGINFFPLTVDFEERLYAAGRIPGSFFRREGRPTESAILTMRLTDRPIRPLFPHDLRNDVQIVITPLSQDEEHKTDILSIIGASAALTISDAPFGGPVGAVRVGHIEGELVINPTVSRMENSALDLRLAGTADAVLMVEAGANEVGEDVMVEALRRGHEAIQDVIRLQNDMREAVGKPKRAYTPYVLPDGLCKIVRQQVGDRLPEAIYGATSKADLNERLRVLRDELVENLGEEWDKGAIGEAFGEVERQVIRRRTIEEGVRADGRDTQTIRPLSAEVGFLPRTHGSGLFTRGETQVLSVATLGTPREEQMLDDLSPEEVKRYIHHYNFPPYSTGETRPLRGPKRREIGHGALAERALLPMIPDNGEFPYTLRVVSEAISSNGSTSMASVCGSTLALMDAGVPIKAPVAGIAMGLMMEGDRYQILTDIQGLEDHIGDMDFKVAGTRKGITALQMDIKIAGLSDDVLAQALEQAYIASTSGPAAEKAQRMIEALTEEAEIGRIYTGRVVRTTNFGAFVEILPGTDGMVHISQLADYRVNTVEDAVRVGDEIMVMVTDISPEGKIRLSRKAVLEGWTPEQARAADRPGGGRSNNSRGRRPPQRR